MPRHPSLLATTVAAGLLAASVPASAARLPVRSYTAADGLASGSVARILVDPNGFLWICTSEGLSRFDGYAFRPYGRRDGLPSPVVNDVLVARDGTYWLATGSGVSRLGASGSPLAAAVALRSVVPVPGAFAAATRLLEDRSGALWCGGVGGLFRLEPAGGTFVLRPVELGLPHELWDDAIVSALAEGADGSIWVGTGSGVTRLRPDGRVEHYGGEDGPGRNVRVLAAGADGSIWVATLLGVGRLAETATGGPYRFAERYSEASGLESSDVHALLVGSDGRLWAGTARGVSVLAGQSFTSYGAAHGIVGPVTAITEDPNGDIWIGCEGLQRLAHAGMTTFDTSDGLGRWPVETIRTDREGRLLVVQTAPTEVWLGSLRDGRFTSRPVGLEAARAVPSWGWNQLFLEDRSGDWWLATGAGLWRFGPDILAPGLSRPRPRRIYSMADGLANDTVFVVFEDSRGDVWLSQASPVTNGLSRWRRATGLVESFREGTGLPPLRTSLPVSFAEDRAGNVWIGFNGSGIVRARGGRFDLFSHADGVPEGWIRALLVDRDGRLWVGAGVGGLAVVDDPTAERPSFHAPVPSGEMASSAVRCLVDDAAGHVYAGTSRGVDRIDVAQGKVHRFSVDDGLAPGPVHSAFRDQEGTLWFGTGRGLSRFVPGGAEPKRSPPAVFVTGLSVEGAPQALPVAGARKVTLPDLPSGRGQVHISFVSPMAWEADTIRYEYRLEGASGEWSPEASERSVDFANLAPGRYRFSVRAVAADGTRSTVPASVEFGVLAPVWRRGWSLAIAATIAALTAWAGFRYRLRNLLALERVRTRIAADLHDDIGSSLSRIAILSEVVKRQTAEGGAESQRFLTEIAESSRELVDSMGDIVWSIDPRRDNLQHLLARIGHFAESVLGAQGIQWTLDVPSDPDRLRLTPEQRRGVYLVLKEAIANAVRHSGCRTLGIRVTVGPDRLSAEVFDDGTGIPPPPAPRGRGLANMESRALEIGAAIRVSSRPGGGTVVRLDLPIRSKGRTGVLWFGRGGRRKIVDRESEDH